MQDNSNPIRARNIEFGGVKITGGSALIVLGLAVLFLLDFALGWLGAGSADPLLKYGLGFVFLVAGLLWFFWDKLFPAEKK